MSEIITRINQAESKYGTSLFYLGISLLLVLHAWYEFSDFPEALRSFYFCVCLCSAGLLLCRVILLAPQHPRYVAGVLWTLAFLCAVYASSKRAEPIVLMLAVAASRFSDHRTTSLVYMIAVSAIIVLVPIFYSLGLTSDVVKRLAGYTGHSWGFFNPNVLAEMAMCGLFAALYYFKVDRFRYLIPVCWISALVIGLVTLCRSTSISLLLFPLFYAVVRKRKGVCRLELLPVCMLALSIILALCFGPVLGENSLVSRFSIPYYVYEHQGIGLVGGGGAMESGVTIDNYILHHVLSSGLLVGGLLLFFYSNLLYRIRSRSNAPLLVSMICCVTLLGFFSITPLDPLRNFMLLFYFDDERRPV